MLRRAGNAFAGRGQSGRGWTGQRSWSARSANRLWQRIDEQRTSEYRDLAEARAQIGVFLEKVYNQKRLHPALGYLPPAEFEHGLLAQHKAEAAALQLSA